MKRYLGFLLVFGCLMLCAANLYAEITVAGRLDLGELRPQYIARGDNILYIGTGMQNHILFVDVSNPASPQLLSDFQITPGSYPAYGGCISGNYCYVATAANGIAVLDISDPAHPTVSATADVGFGTTQNIEVRGNWAYVSVSLGSTRGVNAFDVSDPTHPTRHGRYPRSASWGIDLEGDLCFIAGHYQAGVPYGGFSSCSIANPDSMYGVGGCDSPPWYCVDVEVVGNYAYLTEEAGENVSATRGVRVCDVSNRDTSVVVGFTELEMPPGYMVSWNENLIVAGGLSGVFVYDLSDPVNLRLSGSFSEANMGVNDVVTDGRYVYATNYDELLVLDVSGVLNTPKIENPAPVSFSLEPAYPNPFNSATTITFGLEKLAPTRIRIFDPLGRRIGEVLPLQTLNAGSHSVVWNATGVPAGEYIVRLEAGGVARVASVQVVK